LHFVARNLVSGAVDVDRSPAGSGVGERFLDRSHHLAPQRLPACGERGRLPPAVFDRVAVAKSGPRRQLLIYVGD
jgi:hypothetical protein